MNKMIYKLFSFSLVTLAFAISGCDEFKPVESFYKINPSPTQLQTIDTLKLTPADPCEPNKPAPMTGPEPNELNLTLEQARAYTIENNLDLKVQLLSPSIAGQTLSAEEAKFEAAFVADVRQNKFDTPVGSRLEGSQVTNTTASAGIQKPLTTGGIASVTLNDSKTDTNNEFSLLNPTYESDLAFSLSQPLLRNAGKKFNTYSIRIAKYELDISKSLTKLEIIRVVSIADRLYWRLYAARKALEVRRQEYDLAVAQLNLAKRFVEMGESPEVEIIRAEAGVASKVEGITIAENDVLDRERQLKQVINIPGITPDTKTMIIPVTSPSPLQYDLNKHDLISQAVTNRMELLELELQLAIAAENIDFFKNQALPVVNLDYTYRINGLGATRSDAYDLLWDNRFEDHSLGMHLLVPLGNEAAKSRVRRAIFEKKQRLATKDQRQLTIENEVLGSVDQMNASWQKILASRENSIMSGRLYQAEKRQFELGLRTSTDVLNAQSQYANALLTEVSAITEYEISRVDLAFATGTLLGAAKITYQPPSTATPGQIIDSNN